MGRRGRRWRRRLGLALLLPLLILLRPGNWFGGGARDGGSRATGSGPASQPGSHPASAPDPTPAVRVLPALPAVDAPPASQPQPQPASASGPAPGSAAPGAGSQPAASDDAREGIEARAEDEVAGRLIQAFAALRADQLSAAEAALAALPPELAATRAGARFTSQAARLRERIAQQREQSLLPLRTARARGDVLAEIAALRAALAAPDPDLRARARAECGLPAAPGPVVVPWPEAELTTALHAALVRTVGAPVRVLVQDQIRQGRVYRVEPDLAVVVAVPEPGGTTHPRIAPWDLDPRLLPAVERVHLAALLARRERVDQARLVLGTLGPAERGTTEAVALAAALR